MSLTIHYKQKDLDKKISEKKARECIDFVKFVAEHEGWEIYAEWNEVVDASQAFVHDVGQQLTQAFGGEGGMIIHKSEDVTSDWKDEYIDHLAAKFEKERKNATSKQK